MSEERIARNAPCPCGSGKKYKKCCGKNIPPDEVAVNGGEFKELPNGIKESADAEVLLSSRPKHTMSLTLSEDDDCDGDAKKVVELLLRPFFDEHCSLTDCDDREDFDIAFIETFEIKGRPMTECPNVTVGRYSQMWDMYRDLITSTFENCGIEKCFLTARWDQHYGGVILVIDEDDAIHTIKVAKPDRYGED